MGNGNCRVFSFCDLLRDLGLSCILRKRFALLDSAKLLLEFRNDAVTVKR